MCFIKPKNPTMAQVAEPEQTATPEEIGGQRKAEDEKLFGAEGQTLRVNREAVGTGSTAGGSGLRMM